MGSFSLNLVPGVDNATLAALPPDKDGCITVFVKDVRDSTLPSGHTLRPLFLVPHTVKLLTNDRRNVYPIPADCTRINVETTHGRSVGRESTYFLCLRVIATLPDDVDVWHFDIGPKKIRRC